MTSIFQGCSRAFPALAAALALALPAAASAAGSASFDGQTVHVGEASPGEANDLTIAFPDATHVEISDLGAVTIGAGCQAKGDEPNTAVCPLAAGGVLVETGAGNDDVGTYVPLGHTVPDGVLHVLLGDGNDHFTGTDFADVVDGGPGNDDLIGRRGADTLDGGAGDDKLTGNEGADVLRGGDGNDRFWADGYDDGGVFADVVDGGPGADTLEDYKHTGGESTAPPINVSLDGQANDGRAGEGDNVTGIERIESSSAGTFTGDDGANVFIAPETGLAGTYRGQGGADQLYAGDASGDVVDGGAGDDELSGGFGDDTVTGGPGKDIIAADRPARCNEIHCDIGGGFGNDVVEARDGEIDSISCGPGTDTVRADAADVVAADCENVERSSGNPGNPGGPGNPGDPGNNNGGTSSVSVKLGSTKPLATLLRKGLVVRVKKAAPGQRVTVKLVVAGATARKLKLVTRAKAVTIASGKATASKGGTATIRARFTASARKRLAKTRRLKVTLRVTGAASRSVKLGS